MKGIKQQYQQKGYFALSILSASLLLLTQQSYALQAMDESDLRAVNGQDGIHINTTYGKGVYGKDAVATGISIDEIYWQDQAGKDTTGEQLLKASATGVNIWDDSDDGRQLGTDYKINAGANVSGTNTGVDIAVETNHSLITVDDFKVCANTGCAATDKSFGKMAIQSTSPIGLHFKTTDGLFSTSGTAEFTLDFKNTNIYLGQSVFGSATNLNQLILKNFNFNFDGKGQMYVDAAKGLYLTTGTTGYVDFGRVSEIGAFGSGTTLGSYAIAGKPSNSGLNLEFMLKSNVSPDDGTLYNGVDLYKLDVNKNPVGAKGLIRVGASGRMVNGYLQLRGTSVSGANNIIGYANSSTNPTATANTVMGSTGIGFRMRGEFTNSADSAGGTPTTLEIGGAGLNSYGFEFSQLSPLRSDVTTRAYFDSGNVYVNLANTRDLSLPTNYTFQNTPFGGVSTDRLTALSDYTQKIHELATNPYGVVMAIRGGEFQAVSKRGRFTNSATDGSVAVQAINGANAGTTNTWGLALPFYNLNANIATYGAEVAANSVYYYTLDNNQQPVRNAVGASGNAQRLGFSLAMSTEGVDKSVDNLTKLGNKTTSILVIDGQNNVRNGINKPMDYYMGIRNIDMLLKGYGSIGLENGSINISLKDMLIVMAGEIAAGYLPGAAYKTCPSGATVCTSPVNNFALKSDALIGVKLRIAGEYITFSLIPNSQVRTDGLGNRLSIVGDLKLDATKKNTIQLSDPADGSIVGLDNISGTLQFNNAIVIGPNGTGSGVNGMVGFYTGLKVNPSGALSDVLRVKDVNLYPKEGTGVAQRLGEMVMTGGTLNSRFSIVPR